jgi:hypothetical protein
MIEKEDFKFVMSICLMSALILGWSAVAVFSSMLFE